MLTQHLGLVYHVARQMCRARPMDAELDELVSAGTIGLIEAMDNFDASRGLAFSTFAAPRIRGAMLDELRRQDRVPRSVRRKTRELHGATETLTRTLGRDPHSTELASRLGVDLPTLWRWQSEGEAMRHVSLDQAVDGESQTARTPAELLAASAGDEVDERLTTQQEVAFLREALMELGEQERTVLSLYYFEELKLFEIAKLLGVSESRVSQIRSKAIARLRGMLGALRVA